MLLRPATINDLALLRYWDEQPHVIASDPTDDWEWETELQDESPFIQKLIAELNGRPIGFVQIIDPANEPSHYWGVVSDNLRAIDIWIGEATDLNKGYGTTMMKLAISQCFSNEKVTSILIDPLSSNTKAHRFYKRLGFEFVEERKFGNDDCFVFELKREIFIKTNKKAPDV